MKAARYQSNSTIVDYLITSANFGRWRELTLSYDVPNKYVQMARASRATIAVSGRNLALWFLYTLAVGVFAAYVAGHALLAAASSRQIFRFAGITAFIGYALALWQMSIWYSRAWSMTIKSTVDGLIYALLTAGTLGWLWPR